MDTTQSAPANGLQTLADVILAPKSAFERLRTRPTWGWALVIAIVLGALGFFLVTPAVVHATQASWPAMIAANPQLASLPPARQQAGLQFALAFVHYVWILYVIFIPIGILVYAVIMLIFRAIGGGSASFASLWAASCNIAVISAGISGIVLGIIVRFRGADSFNSQVAVSSALPSLALLAPGAGIKLFTFLAAMNVFTIWAAVLIYVAMRVTAKVSTVPAVLTALIGLCIPALFGAAFAR
jgi:hypothetical protein